MDLLEVNRNNAQRHPWELARLSTIVRLFKTFKVAPCSRVLDIGCGDGFTGIAVSHALGASYYLGVDSNLNEEDVKEFRQEKVHCQFAQSSEDAQVKSDLILLCDLIEHIEDDLTFLRGVVENTLTQDGHLLITVPCYPSLFSRHDSFLKHFRRYRHKDLPLLCQEAGLKVIWKGSMFFSLLPIRYLTCIKESFFKEKEVAGLGDWQTSNLLTHFVTWVLAFENRVLFELGRLGIKLNGLSGVVLCKKL